MEHPSCPEHNHRCSSDGSAQCHGLASEGAGHAYYAPPGPPDWVPPTEPVCRWDGVPVTTAQVARGLSDSIYDRHQARERARHTDGHRDGETYSSLFDYDRLNDQARRVFDALMRGGWYTLQELADITGDGTPSISARIRDLRKAEFGGLTVERQHRGNPVDGLYEYHLIPPAELDPNAASG